MIGLDVRRCGINVRYMRKKYIRNGLVKFVSVIFLTSYALGALPAHGTEVTFCIGDLPNHVYLSMGASDSVTNQTSVTNELHDECLDVKLVGHRDAARIVKSYLSNSLGIKQIFESTSIVYGVVKTTVVHVYLKRERSLSNHFIETIRLLL